MKPLISLVLSLSVGLLIQIDQSKGELESALVSSIEDDDTNGGEVSEANKQRLPQLIRSVNPSAVEPKPEGGDQLQVAARLQLETSGATQQVGAAGTPQLAGQVGLAMDKRSGADWWPIGEPANEAGNGGGGQVQLMRQQPLKQEQLMNLLLSELAMLEFGNSNQRTPSNNQQVAALPPPPTTSTSTTTATTNSLRQFQMNNAALGGQLNRIRSRSTFPGLGYPGNQPAAQSRNSLTGGGGGGGSAAAAAYHQISPMLMGSLEGGSAVSGFTKRPNAHHVPCFFNAITCF